MSLNNADCALTASNQHEHFDSGTICERNSPIGATNYFYVQWLHKHCARKRNRCLRRTNVCRKQCYFIQCLVKFELNRTNYRCYVGLDLSVVIQQSSHRHTHCYRICQTYKLYSDFRTSRNFLTCDSAVHSDQFHDVKHSLLRLRDCEPPCKFDLSWKLNHHTSARVRLQSRSCHKWITFHLRECNNGSHPKLFHFHSRLSIWRN